MHGSYRDGVGDHSFDPNSSVIGALTTPLRVLMQGGLRIPASFSAGSVKQVFPCSPTTVLVIWFFLVKPE